ncbi:nucleoporin Nup43 [Drosophila mauritiana]|uniref:Nucleoporin Nup43 n=1 Tax=Drosophila mauritiana TaxID=7226 RepID=A0A6P8K4V2_DROMA|nr:nucleoporin Nup43 [Drosophila mauritiana]
MSFANVSTHYISEKVSRVRWLPEELQQSERFVTGSWDMDQNFVRLWRLLSNQYATATDSDVDQIPRCMDKVRMEDDVTAMEFVDKDTLAVSCADGHLSVFNVHRAVEEDQMQRTSRSGLLHCFQRSQEPAPCTDLSTYGTDIATAGEDGCVSIVSVENVRQVKRQIEADSMALFSICYISQQELVTANRMGVIRVLDGRVATEAQPKTTFMVASQDDKSNFVSSLAKHPMQHHILLCGSEEGSITVWDMRNLSYPASYLSAHKSPINEIGFHQKDPSKLFTAAEGGEVWMWSENKVLGSDYTKDGHSPWLSGDRVRSLVDVEGVLSNIRKSINSFDVHGSRLVCGGDTEAVYLVDNIV